LKALLEDKNKELVKSRNEAKKAPIPKEQVQKFKESHSIPVKNAKQGIKTIDISR